MFSRAINLMVLTMMLSACSGIGVQPWERDSLAKKEMQFGAEKTFDTMNTHFYYSKEASSGGSGFSGGGCGCN